MPVGGVASMVTTTLAVDLGLSLPAGSMASAVRVYWLGMSVMFDVTLAIPLASANAWPMNTTPLVLVNTRTRWPLVAVMLKVGVVSLVRLSVLLVPVSLASARST